MVKTTGPLLSLAAGGSIADALTTSNWKGRSYTRKKPKPSDPKTGTQVGIRAMFGFLGKNWSGISTSDQATFAPAAVADQISPFNAYLRWNQQRWTTGLYPSQADPAGGGYLPCEISHVTPTIRPRSVSFSVVYGEFNSTWGLLVYRSTSSGFSPAIANCIGVQLWDVESNATYIDGPLQPGTYYYRFDTFSPYGRWEGVYTDQTTIVIT